jgi:Zn finger protein HypA/HybF involved in hydrogenase expression
VKLHCRKCNIDFTSDSFNLMCPECHKLEVDILSGKELYVESMEAE